MSRYSGHANPSLFSYANESIQLSAPDSVVIKEAYFSNNIYRVRIRDRHKVENYAPTIPMLFLRAFSG